MENSESKLIEGKLDLVPMIDCIMLLLLFFILTTSFVAEEKALSALLPTTSGDGPRTEVEIHRPIAIAVYPAGLDIGSDALEYGAAWARMSATAVPQTVAIRIGRAEPLIIDARALSSRDLASTAIEIDRIHAWIRSELDRYELPGKERSAQEQVEVHCFSGLAWKNALVVYDAVRAFERDKGPASASRVRDGDLRLDLSDARAVSLAAPRLRDAGRDALGIELQEIISLH